MTLVDLATAAQHLGQPADEPAIVAVIEPKLVQATAIVIRYIKRPAHGWTMATNPDDDPEFAIVQAAILKVLGNLYRVRGDDETAMGFDPLEGVTGLLSLVRDPTLA